MTLNSSNSVYKKGASNIERPLVSFCILAFNQEQFVEAAMRAAFTQSYESLEIIVSDDGSSDGTWERIQSLATAYKGPHRVLVRRSSVNRGVLHHLLDVAEMASGRLLLVRAADDISLPQRTELMVDLWHRCGYAAAFTDYGIIDDAGCKVADHYHFDDGNFSPRDYISGSNVANIHGASAVYDLVELKRLGRPAKDDLVLFEDTWLSLAFAFTGRPIQHVSDVTVLYRRHAGSITNSEEAATDRQGLEQLARKWQQRSAAFGATLMSFRAWCERQPVGKLAYPLPKRLDKDINYYSRVGQWHEMNTISRAMILRFASRHWMIKTVGLRILPAGAQLSLRQLRHKLFRSSRGP